MKLKVILEPSDEGGYTAIVPSLPGCISESKSYPIAKKMNQRGKTYANQKLVV